MHALWRAVFDTDGMFGYDIFIKTWEVGSG